MKHQPMVAVTEKEAEILRNLGVEPEITYCVKRDVAQSLAKILATVIDRNNPPKERRQKKQQRGKATFLSLTEKTFRGAKTSLSHRAYDGLSASIPAFEQQSRPHLNEIITRTLGKKCPWMISDLVNKGLLQVHRRAGGG